MVLPKIEAFFKPSAPTALTDTDESPPESIVMTQGQIELNVSSVPITTESEAKSSPDIDSQNPNTIEVKGIPLAFSTDRGILMES